VVLPSTTEGNLQTTVSANVPCPVLFAENGLFRNRFPVFDKSRLNATDRPSNAHPLFLSVPPSSSGITWKHVNGRFPNYYLPETTGAGCAFFDYDNDGWMDIFLVNSGRCDFYEPRPPLRNALYRNNRDGTFTDVTESAGLLSEGYGMGVAVGDYDGDGLPDLFLTQYGNSILYHNEGNGKFTDVTKKARLNVPGWSSPGETKTRPLSRQGRGRCSVAQTTGISLPPNLRISCSPTRIRRIRRIRKVVFRVLQEAVRIPL
jgi:hypothetical protein